VYLAIISDSHNSRSFFLSIPRSSHIIKIITIITIIKSINHQRMLGSNSQDDPLTRALHVGDLPTVRQLISDRPSSLLEYLPAHPELRLTPLHLACHHGYDSIASFLITQRADVNAVNYCCDSPLHWAAREGRADIVERLLEQPECRLDACNVESCTALHWASAAGSNASVKALVARKANVNVVDGAGRTPLHYASKAGVRSVVQCLIVALADINAVTTRSRDTPLHVAIEYRRLDVVKCLLEFGARKDVVDRHGHSPIDRASVSDAELAALLRDYGTCDSHTLFRSISSTRP